VLEQDHFRLTTRSARMIVLVLREASVSGRIFISYRRGDDPGNAGRLFDSLRGAFKPSQLFMDVDNIQPGQDFLQVLEEKVAQSDVLLAVIGIRWANALDPKGIRRLDNPKDFVRVEIESALHQKKRVIPVLVGDAIMPTPEELPEGLQPLTERHAVRVTHERFRSDAKGLIKALKKILVEPNPEKQDFQPENSDRLRQVMEALEQHLTAELERQNITPQTRSEPKSDEPQPQDYARLRQLVAELEEHGFASGARTRSSSNLESELEQLMVVLEQRLITVTPDEHKASSETGAELERREPEPLSGLDDGKLGKLMAAIEEQLEAELLAQYGLSESKREPSV
jgi:TIR domain